MVSGSTGGLLKSQLYSGGGSLVMLEYHGIFSPLLHCKVTIGSPLAAYIYIYIYTHSPHSLLYHPMGFPELDPTVSSLLKCFDCKGDATFAIIVGKQWLVFLLSNIYIF
jgi:hypothetical protein